jgi:DNA invertase Pin-like site-specific DNA recombinase
MNPSEPKRVLHAAEALAAVFGVRLADLSAEDRALYLAGTTAVATALAEFDKEMHSIRVRRGQAIARRRGHVGGGRQRVAPEKEEAARQMLLDKKSTREVRAETGLGNSAISRIKRALEATNAPSGSQSRRNARARHVQVQPAGAG